MESVVCGGVAEFDIAGTGAVYIKSAWRSTLFPPPTSGLTIRVEGRIYRFTSRDKKAVNKSVVAVVKF